jgi:threonine/homoserine/homoserine lactone efflux protein
MHGAFLTGLVLGLILAVVTSPVSFSLLNITASKGIEAGAMFVSGIFSSNLLFLTFSIIGFDLLVYEYQLQKIILLFTGILLIILSLSIILNLDRKLISKNIIYFKATNPATIYLKGILLNSLNPLVIILWAGIFSIYFLRIDGNKNEFIAYFFGAIVTVLIFDILKLVSANKISNFINPLYFLFLNKVIAVLIIFSVITVFIDF